MPASEHYTTCNFHIGFAVTHPGQKRCADNYPAHGRSWHQPESKEISPTGSGMEALSDSMSMCCRITLGIMPPYRASARHGCEARERGAPWQRNTRNFTLMD